MHVNALTEVVEIANGDTDVRLTNVEIKKMNGKALKKALGERGVSIHGQIADLAKRLLDFETARK